MRADVPILSMARALLLTILAGCAGSCGSRGAAPGVVVGPAACEPLSDLRWTICDGSAVGDPVYYEVDGCMIGRDQRGEETLFVPIVGSPAPQQVEAALWAERRCISPDATRLADDRFRHVIFMDLGAFIRCDDPACR